MSDSLHRRGFLLSTPLGLMGAGTLSTRANAQHPGFSAALPEAIRYPDRLRYQVRDGAITGVNGTFFNNRPLYCAGRPAAVLGGDRPLLRFIEEHHCYGTFTAALMRDGRGAWFHEWGEVSMEYRPGHILWRLADRSAPGVTVVFEAVPMADRAGFAVRIEVRGAKPGDRIAWAFGGAHRESNAMWAFDPVLAPQDDAWTGRLSAVLKRGTEPERCAGNRVQPDGSSARLFPPDPKLTVLIHCDPAGQAVAGDASAWARPESLLASKADGLPLACGSVPAGDQPLFWTVESMRGKQQAAAPATEFDRAHEQVRAIGQRVVVRTPDPYLDAAAGAANHAVDAVFYPPVFRHGCMAWNVRLPGWRTVFGGTVFGWHDRVLDQARFYLASQVKESSKVEAHSDPKTRLCNESDQSRLWGKGRIVTDASRYDFQSQLFDQLIHAWRWTGSRELENQLRGSLELHAEWMRECFDPDGDGLYESYINTWPTDTVWYDGGGSVEESVYAWTAHRALEDIARRDGDMDRARGHALQAGRIRKALFDVLWMKDKGHFAAYKEQGGRGRVHEDAWLYSEFLPVDAGMTSFEQSAQALHYTEWALENVTPPIGGRRVWSSNWLPSKWSARELYHGDNYHLALAYFKAGLAEDGYEILRGNMLDAGFAKVVPGAQAVPEGGTDFNDVLSMFARTVVEGLFGFAPDMPHDVIRLEPAFPAEWPQASIRTPDFSLTFERSGDFDRYTLETVRPAQLLARIPVRASSIATLKVNGSQVSYQAEAGPHCTMLRFRCPSGPRFVIEVALRGRTRTTEARKVTGTVGERIEVQPAAGRIVEVRDPQSALRDGTRLARPGHSLILVKERTGELERWEMLKLAVKDPQQERIAAGRRPRSPGSRPNWECIDLSPHFNGDIRTIHQQRYLSPRPKTVSVRIGEDGYSPWTFAPWKIPVPEIDLSSVPALAAGPDRLRTPQGAIFRSFEGERNIAFTSLWDNWPDSVQVPVGKSARVAWMLVCGSTNPMQTRIANARLRFRYAGGAEEDLDLIPPLNFWSLCPLGGRDYIYERDGFCLPKQPPPVVQLGKNCRAMVLSWRLQEGQTLEHVTLETLSREVVIGLMGLSLEL